MKHQKVIPCNSQSTNLLQHVKLKNSNMCQNKISKSMLNPYQSPQIVVINNYYSSNGSPEGIQQKTVKSNFIQDKKMDFKTNKANTLECGEIIRKDFNGNEIIRKGKHRISYIDKVSKNRFANIIEIESFKEFNKEEEDFDNKHNKGNSCCIMY